MNLKSFLTQFSSYKFVKQSRMLLSILFFARVSVEHTAHNCGVLFEHTDLNVRCVHKTNILVLGMIRFLRSSFFNHYYLISAPRSRAFYSLTHRRLSDVTHKQQAIRISPETSSDSRRILQAFIIRHYSAANENTAVNSPEPAVTVKDETKEEIGTLPIKVPRVRRTASKYIDAIDHAARRGNMETVEGLFRGMKQHGFEFNIRAFTSVINHYAKQGNMKKALQYFRIMRSKNIKSDAYIYTILIDGYMRVSNLSRSERFYKKMLLENLSPSVPTWNVLIYNSTVQLDMKTATSFLEGMIKTGLKPDIYTFSIIINGYKLHNDIEGAWRFYRAMIGSGITQNEVTASILMHLYLQRHENEQVKDLFSFFFGDEQRPGPQSPPNKPQMIPLESGLKTNTILLNALLGPADHKFISYLYKKIYSTVKEVLDNNGQITEIADVYTFTSFMRAFIRRNDHNSVVRILRDMNAHGIKPTLVTYNILILSCAFSAEMDRATNVLEHMISYAKFKPDVATYTIMMRGWIAAKNFSRARVCYKDMVTAGITPNYHTLKVIRWMKRVEKDTF